jgi:serine/threonine-protein kinase
MADPRSGAPLTIGRYAFYGEIASGGMATVHFARLVGPGNFSRIVAAKRLLPHLVSDPAFTSMLMDEARLAARIRHPNVASTLDVVSTGQELVVVMDYVHGEALSRLMRTATDLGERVPLPIATTIIVDALHGLHAAHQARDESGKLLGLVHRDVSPQNLLVGVDGVTQIADFGIALSSGRSQETRNGSVKGKISYMAPEQIERQALTPATDVFSLSIVLWELVTGERLFAGENDGEIVQRILSGNRPPPSASVPQLPPAYDRILARGLARSPAQRYATAREMALDLERETKLVRPSEVGAWVARTASDTLTRRSRIIAQLESTAPVALDDADAPQTRVIRASVGSDALGTGARVSWARSDAGRKPGGLHLLALAATLAAAGGALWYAPRAQPTAHVVPSRTASPPRLLDSAAPSPSALAVEPAASPPHAADATATSATNATAAAESARTTAQSEAKPKRASPSVRARPRPSTDCDPPYSIDASGRRLFKLECM